MNKLTEQQLLTRVDLKISLEQLAVVVASEFSLGKLVSFKPMPVGYEELNALLVTTKGKYVVKIFSKDKDLRSIESNVRALREYHNGGIPTPRLYFYQEEKCLFKIIGTKTYLIVMNYFDGKKFTEVQPLLDDFTNIARILAKINRLYFKTSANYDPWLTIYLPKEFEKKRKYLDNASLSLIKPIVEKFKTIDYSRLPKSIVHYDLHRENVMKNKDGDYCILDLACTDFNYRIFDLATYIGLFCIDSKKSLTENIKTYQEVVKAYSKVNKLNEYELKTLPLIVKGSMASNLLIPEYLQNTKKDENPKQTVYYKSIAVNGLRLFQDIEI